MSTATQMPAMTENACQAAPFGVAVEKLFNDLIGGSAVSDPLLAQKTAHRLVSILDTSPWADVAWSFSELTRDGCPVEICFSTADRMLRYTVEAAGLEMPNDERLDAICNLASNIGSRRSMDSSHDSWRQMQAGARLDWGAALGVRHGTAGEQVKLYLEVPASGEARLLQSRYFAHWLHPDSRVVMIGYDPLHASEELYFKLPLMSSHEAAAVGARLRTNVQTVVLLPVLEHLLQMPIEIALTWVRIGYSVAVVPGIPTQFSLFFRSPAAGQQRVSKCFLEIARENNVCTPYKAFTPLWTPQRPPDHGVVALTCRSGRVEMRIGLSARALVSLLPQIGA